MSSHKPTRHKPSHSHKQILQQWVTAAELFAEHGGGFSNARGGHLYQFARATEKASRRLKFDKHKPYSFTVNGLIKASKDPKTGKIDEETLHLHLFVHKPFANVMRYTRKSVHELYKQARHEDVITPARAKRGEHDVLEKIKWVEMLTSLNIQ